MSIQSINAPSITPTQVDTNNSDQDTGRFVKQSKDNQKIISWAMQQFQNIKMSRSYIERQWYLNLCFYYGKQNVVFKQNSNFVVGVSGALYVPPAPYWRSRPVINRIRPIIRTEHSKLNSQKPSATIVPGSADDLDLFAAQAGEQIWESVFQNKKLARTIRRWTWWGLVTGNSFLKCYWNPDAIDKDSDQMGDFEYKAETPFHVFVPDFREQELEEQPFIIHAHVKTEDWVKTNFSKVNLNYSANFNKENEIIDSSWLNIIGARDLQGSKGVLVLEVWVKPGGTPQFPNGAMFTIIGQTIVQGVEGWPYDHGLYPFAHFQHIDAGKFYADSSIVDIIPLQREYNRTRGQLIEAKNKMAKPQLIAEKGAIDPGKITSEPGQIIEYQPGFQKPEPLAMPQIPAYVEKELERIMMDINDISGQHEVSHGQVPPGVTAATAISYLQEQDETMLFQAFQSMEEGIEKAAKMTLGYVHQFWDTPRIIKTVGTDGSFDALAFKGSDLRGNTDIRVEAGSSLPTSKAAKQAFILDLMKMGFIDPQDGLEVMEMGGIQKIYENVQVDVRQAQRENLRMAAVDDQTMAQFELQSQMEAGETPDPEMQTQQQPLIVPVHTFDNHQLHIQVHNKYRKSQAFENLGESSKQVFEQHVQQHMAADQQIQMQQAMVSSGGMGGGPNPPGNHFEPGAARASSSGEQNIPPTPAPGSIPTPMENSGPPMPGTAGA